MAPRRAEPRSLPEMQTFGVTLHEAARVLNWMSSDISGPKISQELGDMGAYALLFLAHLLLCEMTL